VSRIFLSYRRDDAQGEARHLLDDLKKQFGQHHVFMDVTGIDPGRDFREAIDKAVSNCDVLIVVIGKQWLDITGDNGKRR
jgi:TIR domain